VGNTGLENYRPDAQTCGFATKLQVKAESLFAAVKAAIGVVLGMLLWPFLESRLSNGGAAPSTG
jgi:hypothetical protein